MFILIFLFSCLSSQAQEELISAPATANLNKTLDSKKIKLLVWNIKKAEAGDKWKQDYDRLASQHDIIAIQETKIESENKTLTKKTQILRQDTAVSFEKSDKSVTGVTTSSKADPISIKPLTSPDREPFLNTPKMSILTTYQLNEKGQKLLLVNTHAINFVSDEKFERQMLDIAKYIKNKKGQVAWAGDFNTWSSSRLAILNKVAEGLDMLPVDFKKDNRSTFMLGHKVDHVFVRGLSVTQADVYDKISSSDHRPISVTLALDPQFDKKVAALKKEKKKSPPELNTQVDSYIKFLEEFNKTISKYPIYCY